MSVAAAVALADLGRG
ncbi:hypothetical protein, partial [Mycobacterium malmoense]